jgi:hypothetical protein
VTKYEARGLAAGRTVYDLDYVRSPTSAQSDLVVRTPLPEPDGEESW